MKRTFLYISLCILCACSGTDDDIVSGGHEQEEPISFSVATQSEGEVITRATTEPLSQDFVVFGFKNVGGVTQTVFDGYNVKYEGKDMTGITPYSYVGGTSIKDVTQEPKYWDYSAEDYRFLAISGKGSVPVSVATSSSTATMTVGNSTTPISDVDQFYIAEPNRVTSTDYRNVVTLLFKHLCAKVELRFYTTIPFITDKDVIKLSNITFAPSNGYKIATQGQIIVEYPLTGNPKETITWPEGTLDNMTFKDLELRKANKTSNTAAHAIPAKETGTDAMVYTVYPFDSSTPFQLTLKQAGESKSVSVPAAYTNWKANNKYIYLFKISEGEPLLYDVKVVPWNYGGELDLEFKNW